VAGTCSIQATGAGSGASPEAIQILSNTGIRFQGQGNAANIKFRSYNTNLNDSGDINFISETEEGQAGNVSFSSIATDANGTAGEIRLAGAGISTSATDAVPLGLVIASNGHVKTGSVGDTYTLGSSTDGSNVKLNLDAANGTDSAVTLTGAGGLTIAQTNDIVTLTAPAGSDTTYTLAAGVKSATSVPLNLTPSTGSGTAVNLTEGTGITLTQTSATEITIAGVAQGVTGSGTVNKLPKFGTTTSLTDSLVSEVPASSSSSYTADNTFFVDGSNLGFFIMSSATPRTIRWIRSQDIDAFPTLTFPPNLVTGTGVLVLTGDIILDADSTDVITAGTYNVDLIAAVSGGVWNSVELTFSASDWLQASGVGGNVSYANSGAVTSLVATIGAVADAEVEIAAKLDMTTHKIINVVNPTDAQDAATKQYVDDSVVGGLIYQGGYNASTDTPVLDSVGTQIAVSKGWTYTVTADGTFYTETVKIGDVLIAEVDIAAGTGALTDWTTVQSNIDLATETIQGIANFPTGNNQLNIATGSVTAKTFGDGNLGTSTTGGYVPDATSAAAGTFLKKDGTWAVAGSLTGTGTQYKVPLWSNVAGTALGNSLFTQDSSATKVTLDGLLEVLGDGTLTGTGGQIKLNCSFGTHGITIESAPHNDNATYTLILPASAGATGQVLTSGGSSAGAQLSWTALPASYTSWSASSDQNTNIAITDGTVLDFSGRLASDGTYGSGLSLG
ncbi:MAG: beta strand repeat-containing protein, partial [Methylophagaceae bacterium]